MQNIAQEYFFPYGTIGFFMRNQNALFGSIRKCWYQSGVHLVNNEGPPTTVLDCHHHIIHHCNLSVQLYVQIRSLFSDQVGRGQYKAYHGQVKPVFLRNFAEDKSRGTSPKAIRIMTNKLPKTAKRSINKISANLSRRVVQQ